MDYIIFRKSTNDFMRWSGDNRIFLTADYAEIKEEFNIEVKDNTEPVIISLKYKTLSVLGKSKNALAICKIGKNEIGRFNYTEHEDDYNYDSFYSALEKWAETYCSQTK